MAAGTPQVLLPWDNAEIFQSNLESYGGGRLASWTVWVAPTTMRTADAAKRVGMSEADFRSVNAIPPRVMIKAGSSLLVPRSNGMNQDVASKLADNGQLSLAPEIVLKRTLVKAGKGETVASIARKYKINADQVAQWNKVGMGASFKPGHQIVLFLAAPPATKAAAPMRTVARKAAPHRVATATRKAPATRIAKR
jgi:membrane-bound lytic murein transglycosylase D